MCLLACLSVHSSTHPSVPDGIPAIFCLGVAPGQGARLLFGTVRKLEPASLLLIDIGALQWDVGPAGASADEIGGGGGGVTWAGGLLREG